MASTTILFNSSSGGAHRTEVMFDGGNVVSIECTCPAGRSQQLCKHIKCFFTGDLSMLHLPQQHQEMHDIHVALQGSVHFQNYHKLQQDLRQTTYAGQSGDLKRAFIRRLRGLAVDPVSYEFATSSEPSYGMEQGYTISVTPDMLPPEYRWQEIDKSTQSGFFASHKKSLLFFGSLFVLAVGAVGFWVYVQVQIRRSADEQKARIAAQTLAPVVSPTPTPSRKPRRK